MKTNFGSQLGSHDFNDEDRLKILSKLPEVTPNDMMNVFETFSTEDVIQMFMTNKLDRRYFYLFQL